MNKEFKGDLLKKTKTLAKAISKTESSFRNSRVTSTEEAKLFNLPPIEKNLYHKAIMQPTSILTRYLEKHTQNFLRSTEEEMNKPIKIKTNIKSKRNLNENKNDEQNSEKGTKREKDMNCITDRSLKNKFDKKLLYLTETKNITRSPSKKTSSKSSSNKNLSIKYDDNLSDLFSRDKNIPDEIRVEEELSYEKMKKLEKHFRRVKNYQPKIYTNWKSKCGLSVTVGGIVSHSPIQNDIEYQSKIFRDQSKLLEDNILYYKMNITTKQNYIESFKSLSLISKINYNKALEETIGIILLLPQLILLDFYNLIKKFENISIPKQKKFEKKYVFDEVENLYFNNNLLSEVLEFFQSCFEVYLLLINEVDDMSLKSTNFNNVIISFEKARYNICYVVNSSENAIKNYNKDIRSISKFNKGLGINNNTFDKINLRDKFMNQFIFKKNEERQRKIRIDACLNYKKEEDDTNTYKKKNNSVERLKFKSVIDSELVSKLLRNCKEDAKHKITTERINNEIDGKLGEEGEILKNSKRQVIKLNF